jgi:hypothetical protein
MYQIHKGLKYKVLFLIMAVAIAFVSQNMGINLPNIINESTFIWVYDAMINLLKHYPLEPYAFLE